MLDALEALPAPRTRDPRDAPVLRWGVLGVGRIGDSFADALARHTDQRIVAVGSRDADRAGRFAAAHGVDRAHGSYADLVSDAAVDVVYVATEHVFHEEHALLALAAGRPVVVEKPFALTEASARRVADAARAAGVFAMEAMWTRYRPHADIVRQVVERGGLGEIRLVTASFGGTTPFVAGDRLFDPARGGGVLFDLGVYPVSWASMVLPDAELVVAAGDTAPSGVDRQASLLLQTDAGAQAFLHASWTAPTPRLAVITGEHGSLELPSPFWEAPEVVLRGVDRIVRDVWADPRRWAPREAMSFEAAAVARYVAEGRTESPLHPLDRAVRDIGVVERARAAIVGA